MQTNTKQQRFPLPEPFAILPSYPNQPPGTWFPMQNCMQPIPSYPYPGTSWAPCTGLQAPSPGYAHTIETGPWNQISNSAFSHGLYPISNMMGPIFSQQPSSNIMDPNCFQGSYPFFNNMGPYIPVQPKLCSTDTYYPHPYVIGANEEPVVAHLNYVSIDSFHYPMDPRGLSMNMNSSNSDPEATIEPNDLETAGGDPETAVDSELSQLEYFDNKLSISIPSEDKEKEQPGSQGTAMEHEFGQEIQAEQDGHSEANSRPRKTFCNLCKSNKESKIVYTSHVLRDESRLVQCPILRAFVCPICNATGDNAHTRRHCPMIKEAFQNPFLYSKQTNSTGDQVLIRYV